MVTAWAFKCALGQVSPRVLCLRAECRREPLENPKVWACSSPACHAWKLLLVEHVIYIRRAILLWSFLMYMQNHWWGVWDYISVNCGVVSGHTEVDVDGWGKCDLKQCRQSLQPSPCLLIPSFIQSCYKILLQHLRAFLLWGGSADPLSLFLRSIDRKQSEVLLGTSQHLLRVHSSDWIYP